MSKPIQTSPPTASNPPRSGTESPAVLKVNMKMKMKSSPGSRPTSAHNHELPSGNDEPDPPPDPQGAEQVKKRQLGKYRGVRPLSSPDEQMYTAPRPMYAEVVYCNALVTSTGRFLSTETPPQKRRP